MRRFCACLLVVMARAAPTSDPPAAPVVNLANIISSEEKGQSNPSWYPSTRCSAGVIHTTTPGTKADQGGSPGADFVPLAPSDPGNVSGNVEGEIIQHSNGDIEGEIIVPDDILDEDGSAINDNTGGNDDQHIEGELDIDSNDNGEGDIELYDGGDKEVEGEDSQRVYKVAGEVNGKEDYIEGEIEVDDEEHPDGIDSIEGEIEIEDSGDDPGVESEHGVQDNDNDNGEQLEAKKPSNYRGPSSTAEPIHIIDDQ